MRKYSNIFKYSLQHCTGVSQSVCLYIYLSLCFYSKNYESLSIYRETLPNQLYHLICFINQNFCLFWLCENPIIFRKYEKVWKHFNIADMVKIVVTTWRWSWSGLIMETDPRQEAQWCRQWYQDSIKMTTLGAEPEVVWEPEFITEMTNSSKIMIMILSIL